MASQFQCRPVFKNGTLLGRPRRIRWRVRWEGGLGWGIHVNPWLIHIIVWQKPLQYCKVISLQLITINGKKNGTLVPTGKFLQLVLYIYEYSILRKSIPVSPYIRSLSCWSHPLHCNHEDLLGSKKCIWRIHRFISKRINKAARAKQGHVLPWGGTLTEEPIIWNLGPLPTLGPQIAFSLNFSVFALFHDFLVDYYLL